MERTKIPPMTEKKFLQQVRDLAKLCGWLVYHTYDSRRSPEGFPDLVLVRNDKIIFAELKSEKGRTTSAQEMWLKALEKVPGVDVHLWRPSDWDRIVEILR